MANSLPSRSDGAKGAFVASRASAYVRAGHDVLVIVPSSTEESLPHMGYDEIRVKAIDEVPRVIDEFAADVVAGHSPDPASLCGRAACLVASQIRTVIWVHGYEALYTGLHGYQPPLRVIPSLGRDYMRLRHVRRTLEIADAVVFVSEWLRRTAERNTGSRMRMSVVIPNPIDTELFVPERRTPRTGVHLVSVRGLRRQYGLDIAIRALAGMKGTDLTIVGKGPLLNRYESLAARCSAPVRFLPPTYTRGEMARVYAEYDAYLAPSRTETQGVAMCEAMSCGIPVIAARVGGIPEFVEDRVSGILVSPNNPRAFRRAIEELVSSPETMVRMGIGARKAVLRKCDETMTVRQELAVLRGDRGER